MYHIKPDKRSQTSASMLYEALMEYIREKEYGEMSITELAARAGVGRSTFYRNFDEVSDLLYWKCDQQFYEVLHSYVADERSVGKPLGLLEHVFGYWLEHSEVLEILLSVNRIDIIYDCFLKNTAVVMNSLLEKFKLPPEEYAYFTSIRIGVFVGVIQTWLQGGKKENAQQLSQILGKQFTFVANHELIF